MMKQTKQLLSIAMLTIALSVTAFAQDDSTDYIPSDEQVNTQDNQDYN